ncbi:MAG: DEAD/DEAH box helicase [Planctomycetota bacterium]
MTSDDVTGDFGLMVSEAADRLVDLHDESLDKRAALLTVEAPTLRNINGSFRLDFSVKGNRQRSMDVAIEITLVDENGERLLDENSTPDEDGALNVVADEIAVDASPSCDCSDCAQDGCCSHALAVSWWLQEQLGRRPVSEIFQFFGDLDVDEVAAGRELVSELLQVSSESVAAPEEPTNTRLQWRVGFSSSRYYSPISITPYEQRPRKNGKGWTKGKEIRQYDLFRRDFTSRLSDGRIASLVSNPTYSFEEEHYDEFRALLELVGHPCVAWDDAKATPITVHSAELAFHLEPVDRGDSGSSELNSAAASIEEGDETNADVLFRPKVIVSGLNVDIKDCAIEFGYASAVEPVIALADVKNDRLIICSIRDPRAERVISVLFNNSLSDVLLDSEAASHFAVRCGMMDSLIRIDLPPQLAGPIEDVNAELVIELRPRLGAGLHIALRMHEPRFRDLMVPGHAPAILPCLTDDGPVRLQRDLDREKQEADRIRHQFNLDRFNPDERYGWIAETDEQALEVLAAFYNGGETTPRMIWPEGESIRVRGEITPGALRVQIDDGRDWFGLNGSISLDGREVPLAELLAAVRDNRSLVQVGDRQFARISDQFRRRLQQLGDAVVAERGALKVADAAVPVVQELISTDVSLEASARWHESLKRLEELADWTPSQPTDLDATLRDYQLDGFQWLSRLSAWGVGGVLADDMGLGKTVQALGVLVSRASEGPALVVAPTSVGENWVRETNRFTPKLSPYLYRDADRLKLIQAAGPGDLIIVSYQLLQRDIKNLSSIPWSTLVLDEAQFIKNSQTKTSQAVRQIEASWRIGLSGTPLENHLGELWSLFRTISPGLLGSWDRFRNRFAEPIERHKDADRRESLAKLMRPFILRRTKDRVLKELPPRTEITLQAELSSAERKIYEEARVAALSELSAAGGSSEQAGQQRIRTLAWLTRLRQIACHPKLVEPSWTQGSAKLSLLMELIDELHEGDHRALVFSQFVKHLEVIRESLDAKAIPYQYLDGSTPAKERQRRVDAFQEGEGELFLISLKAGGTGLNLTGADYVIHLDPWWNPAVEDQATDRAHRIGQQRPVTVYRLVAEGTIEEQILQLHADKRELVAGVLDGSDRAAKMKTEDLIQLIKEGVSE